MGLSLKAPTPPLALLLAVVGYVFTTWNAIASDQRRGQIERVNEQVKELYGPLLMCITATKSAYDAMVHQLSPDGTVATFVEACKKDVAGAAAAAYRDWVREVFMPLNEKAASVLMERADLLEKPVIEPLLQQLVAHVSAMKVILKQWEHGDLTATSVVSYPDALHEKVQTQYLRAKRRQAMLLGMSNTQIISDYWFQSSDTDAVRAPPQARL